jgi:hypothetical protein
MELIPYREIMGKLQHLTIHTRPDIAYEVGTLGKYNQNPGRKHWLAVKQLLRYLKYSHNYGIQYKQSGNMTLRGYADASFAQCPETGRSVGGYIFQLGTNTVSWKSKWFQTVYPSSSESEMSALFEATSQTCWMRKVMRFLGHPQTKATIINEDNQGTIKYSYSQDRAGRMKHIDTRLFWVREKIQDGTIQLSYIPSEENKADIMTKSLKGKAFTNALEKLGISRPDYVNVKDVESDDVRYTDVGESHEDAIRG